MAERSEQDINNMFCAFCLKVLRNEANDIYRSSARIYEYEKPISSLTREEKTQAITSDKYFSDEYTFLIQGMEIKISDENLAEAIKSLDSPYKEIILLSYFLGMKDAQIAKQQNVVRQTITKRRAKSINQLKAILEREVF